MELVKHLGTKVISPDRTGCYEIALKAMHGDADSYTNHQYFFTDTQEFYKIAVFLSHYFSVNRPDRNNDEFSRYFAIVAERYKINIEDINPDDDFSSCWKDIAANLLYDFVGYDATLCDGTTYAALDKLKFFYHTSAIEKEVLAIKIGSNYYSDFCYFDKIDFYYN